MPTLPLKVGSAPPAVAHNMSPSSAWRTGIDVSPIRRTPPSRGITFDSGRPSGVLHRIDSAAVLHSSLSLDRINSHNQLRCPACRRSQSLVCGECVIRRVNVPRLRDVHRQLLLRKAELCRRIETELQPLSYAQADLHAATRRIKAMRVNIEKARERIERLQRSRVVQTTRYAKSEKNVNTLEKKAFSHAARIEKNAVENAKLLAQLQMQEKENFTYVRFLCMVLAHYMPIMKHDLVNQKQKPSTANTPPQPVKSWPPVKRHYFTLNGCEVHDNSEYGQLESELVGGSSLVLSSRAQPTFAALLQLAHLVGTFAFLADVSLPYGTLDARAIATWSRWTPELFASDVFRLNTNVVALVAAFGMRTESMRAASAFGNIHTLVQELNRKDSQVCTTKGVWNEQMKHQLIDLFNKFTFEEREQGFDCENVEEDWVSVQYVR